MSKDFIAEMTKFQAMAKLDSPPGPVADTDAILEKIQEQGHGSLGVEPVKPVALDLSEIEAIEAEYEELRSECAKRKAKEDKALREAISLEKSRIPRDKYTPWSAELIAAENEAEARAARTFQAQAAPTLSAATMNALARARTAATVFAQEKAKAQTALLVHRAAAARHLENVEAKKAKAIKDAAEAETAELRAAVQASKRQQAVLDRARALGLFDDIEGENQ